MKIGIGNDHHGVEVKKRLVIYLENLGYEVVNFGSDVTDMVDYPKIAFSVGESVSRGEVDRGILICMSGIGMSIAANKVHGVRCAKVNTAYEVEMGVMHNHANMMALSSELSLEQIQEMVDMFVHTEYSLEERHQRRVEEIDRYHEL